MALEIVWAQAAWTDLESVADYIAKGSVRYAAVFVNEVRDAARSLENFPHRGRYVPEFEDNNLRELFIMNYRLIYRFTTQKVSVVALIHGSRDLWSLWKGRKSA